MACLRVASRRVAPKPWGPQAVCSCMSSLSSAERTSAPLSPVTSREIVEKKRQFQEAKYGKKLLQKMKEEGVEDLAELKSRLLPPLKQSLPRPTSSSQFKLVTERDNAATASPPLQIGKRVDGSPLKPLEQILNVDRLLEAPHTSAVIHALWTTYHASRSAGTGRGFLSATMPKATYLEMLSLARKYPVFVVPLPRAQEGESDMAWEFYLMEWSFFEPPPEPRHSSDLLNAPTETRNPPCSTVLFTPLQEYKLRQSFAQPYLVLCHYSDLAHSHDLILLRGEITPCPHSPSRHLLSQHDAQMLAIAVQRFYLSNTTDTSDAKIAARRQLLLEFHEDQDHFRWEDLMEAAWDI